MSNTDKQKVAVLLAGLGYKPSILSNIEIGMEKLLIDYSIITMTPFDEMIAQLSQQIPDDSIIIAWSLGGLIAMNLCYQFPEKANKLILVNTSPKFLEESEWRGISSQQAENFTKKCEEQYSQLLKEFSSLILYPVRDVKLRAQLFEHLHSPTTNDIFKHHLKLLFELDNRALYFKLMMPVLHIFGEQDAIVPASLMQQLNTSSNIKMELINKSGHIPFLSHKIEFENSVNRFINDVNY